MMKQVIKNSFNNSTHPYKWSLSLSTLVEAITKSHLQIDYFYHNLFNNNAFIIHSVSLFRIGWIQTEISMNVKNKKKNKIFIVTNS